MKIPIKTWAKENMSASQRHASTCGLGARAAVGIAFCARLNFVSDDRRARRRPRGPGAARCLKATCMAPAAGRWTTMGRAVQMMGM